MQAGSPELSPDFEGVCAVLESVARGYPEGSEQAKAIEEAAGAYLFLQLHLKLRHAYQEFWRKGSAGLTEDQERNLRDLGIDLDED